MQSEQAQKPMRAKSSKLWGRMALFVLSGVIFMWSFQQIALENSIAFDLVIRETVNSWNAAWLVGFFHFFTILGDKAGVITIMLFAVFLIWWKTRDFAAIGVLITGVIIVNELNKWLKDLTGRERPMTGPGAESLSFPSGHAMVGLFFYGLLLYYALTHLKTSGLRLMVFISGILFIFLLGISRIFLNYHYPSDVFAGYAAGYICLLIAVLAYEWIQTFLAKRAM